MTTAEEASCRPPPTREPIRIEFYGSAGGADGTPWREPLGSVDRPFAPRGRGSGRGSGGAGSLAALLVAVALVLGAVGVAVGAAIERRSADTGSLADPEPSARPGAAADASTEPRRTVSTLPPAHAEPLPFPGGDLEPGRYVTDLLGVPVEFTVAEATAVRTGRPGAVLLSPVGSASSTLVDAPHVQFVRLGAWNTAEQAVDRTFQGVGGIPASDIDAWLADNDVIVERSRDAVVAGRPSRVLDVRVDPASPHGDGICVPALRPCFWYSSVPAEDVLLAPIRLDHPLSATMSIRLWVITIAGHDPILVEAAAVAGDVAALDRFEATTIASLHIGPSPVELLAGSGSGVPPSG